MSSEFSSNSRKDRYVTPMEVQERTLKVTNYGRSVTESILKELFSQVGDYSMNIQFVCSWLPLWLLLCD